MSIAIRDVVGRDAELAEIARFLDDLPTGGGVLLIEGEPGIGKTTLWRACTASARERGFRVLSCAPAAAEARLSLAGLSDLVGDALDDVVDALPKPQRDALLVALGRAEGTAPEALTVSLASLGVVQRLAEGQPVLLAIDDVQWLDSSSAAVVNFVGRRVPNDGVGIVVARRQDESDALDTEALAGDALVRTALPPFGIDELAHVVRDRLGVDLARPLLERVMRASGGNPFFAIEIVRALPSSGVTPKTLPVPANVQHALSERLDLLGDTALEVLLVVSALARPTLSTLVAAVGDAERVNQGLQEAEAADVIHVDGHRVRFTHPLLDSTVYGTTSATERRLLHGRLRDVVDDPEERARHGALAASGPSSDVADELESAASGAIARGAPAGAAELLDLAWQLTPVDDSVSRVRRMADAARFHFESGDAKAATDLLTAAAELAPAGTERGTIFKQLAAILRSTDGVDAATRMYERALTEAGDSGALQAAIHEALAWMRCWTGSVPGTYVHARAAFDLMDGVDDDALRMAVLGAVAESEFHMGMASAHETIKAALRLEETLPNAMSAIDSPTALRASHLVRMDELDEAEELFNRCLERADAEGDEASKSQIYAYAAIIDYERGRLDDARAYLRRAEESARQNGQVAVNAGVKQYDAYIDAVLGNVDEAREIAMEGLVIAREQHAHQWREIRLLHVLGFIELSAGAYQDANGWLDHAYRLMVTTGVREPGSFSHLVPDHIETLIALGRLEEARTVIDEFEAAGHAVGRRRVLVSTARCRGLLLAASDNLDGAREVLTSAVLEGESLPYRMDFGRTLLALGTVHRRAKQKKLARDTLAQASEVFDEIGATLWSARARSEAARIGGRVAGPIELTDTEAQIAKLVAEGHTNKEVAAQLFLSVRSVEANLSKVYRKLQVRSRTELTQRLHTSG